MACIRSLALFYKLTTWFDENNLEFSIQRKLEKSEIHDVCNCLYFHFMHKLSSQRWHPVIYFIVDWKKTDSFRCISLSVKNSENFTPER